MHQRADYEAFRAAQPRLARGLRAVRSARRALRAPVVGLACSRIAGASAARRCTASPARRASSWNVAASNSGISIGSGARLRSYAAAARRVPVRRSADLRGARLGRDLGAAASSFSSTPTAGRRCWPGCRRTISPPMASCGAIRCTTGSRPSATSSASGARGSPASCSASTWCASITSAASPAYWAVPAGARTAREGRWCPAPGARAVPGAAGGLSRTCRWWRRIWA